MCRRAGRAAPDEAGFTLVELMMALLLLAILLTSTAYAAIQGMKLNRDEQDRQVAADIGSGVLQQTEATALTAAGFTTVSATVNTPSVTTQADSGVTYTSTETSEWESQGQNSSVCKSGTNVGLILRVTVTTKWSSSGFVSESTLLAPPNGTLNASSGSVPVLVQATDGTPQSGITVTLTPTGSTPGSPASITTGSDGCAFFANLAQGTYNATAQSSGGVSITESPTYISSLTVNGSLGTTVNVYYMTAGSIVPTFGLTSPPPASGMPVSIDNPSQGLNPPTNIFTFGPGTPVLTPVYPSVYIVFAGSCTDADPNGMTSGSNPQPFYPPATYPNIAASVAITVSVISSVTVPLYPLNFQVQPKNGVASTAAASGTNTAPTATAGQGGVCVTANPTYTLSPVVSGVSSTSVGLGEMTINVTVSVTTSGGPVTESGSVQVWVKPNGVYMVNGGVVASSPVTGNVLVPVS
jgi:prepilin-type N-terminal cleavage/methylation domain-containing protein